MSCYMLCYECGNLVLDIASDEYECRKLGEPTMRVMHDGIEHPTDLCDHYERKGDGYGE